MQSSSDNLKSVTNPRQARILSLFKVIVETQRELEFQTDEENHEENLLEVLVRIVPKPSSVKTPSRHTNRNVVFRIIFAFLNKAMEEDNVENQKEYSSY